MGKHGPDCCKEKKLHPLKGCTVETCAQCKICLEHAMMKAATLRRRANGIRLGRWQIMTNKDNIVSLDDFWRGWVESLGAQKAADYLVVVMRRGDEALRDALARRKVKHAASDKRTG